MTEELGGLPAIPDRKSGLPKPPHAPIPPEFAARVPKSRSNPGNDRDRLRSPVKGQPALTWHYTNMQTFYKLITLGIVLGVLVGFVLQALDIPPTAPAFGWLAVAVGVTMGLIQARPKRLAAGARWLTLGKRSIRLYELTRIELKSNVLGPLVRMADRSGSMLTVLLQDLCTNQDLWDYVHLGMQYSASKDAVISARASAELGLHTGGSPGFRS